MGRGLILSRVSKGQCLGEAERLGERTPRQTQLSVVSVLLSVVSVLLRERLLRRNLKVNRPWPESEDDDEGDDAGGDAGGGAWAR